MKHLGFDADIHGVVGCARTGVVGHHAPALWGLVVDVGRQNKRWLGSLGCDHFDTLNQVVDGARQRFDFVDALWTGLHTAIGEHRLKGRAYRPWPDQPGSAWMDAHDVIFFCPAPHQHVNVCVLERFVKVVFNVICGATDDGRLEFGSFHDG